MTSSRGVSRDRASRRARSRVLAVAVGRHAYLSLVSAIMIVPILWVVLSSFKPPSEVQQWPPVPFSATPSIASYERVFSLWPVGQYYLNTIGIMAMNVVFNVLFCSLAGYTLARTRFRGRSALMIVVLVGMVVPVYVRLIPSIQLTSSLGLNNTLLGIVLPTAATAFGIFFMRQFFVRSVPVEVEEAARIDGCSDWGVLFRIMIPLLRPAVITLVLLAMSWSVEDFLWPMMITDTASVQPIQVGMVLSVSDKTINWGPVTAFLTLTIVPIGLAFMFFQRYFVEGMAAGAVKE